MNITFKKFSLVLILFYTQGCLLTYVTEPDEQALASQANGGIIENKNGACGINPPEPGTRAFYNSRKKDYRSIVLDLVKKMSHSSDVVRTNAATEIGNLGAENLGDQASISISKLENLAESDTSKWVRRASIKALAKIGSPSSLSVITSSFKDPDPYVRHSAENAKKLFMKSQKARLN